MSVFQSKDLIREIKCRPPIYDRDLLEEPKREHKHQLWLEVAGNLTPAEDWEQYTDVDKDARIDELQAKWKHLKDHFHRELKLIDAGEAHKKRKYVFFDDMEFMRPFVGFKFAPTKEWLTKTEYTDSMEFESIGNVTDVTDAEMESLLKTNDLDDDTETPSKRPKRNIKPTPKATQKKNSTPVVKKIQKDADIKNVDVLQKPSSISKGGPNPTFKIRDGDISFCLSLVPNLRKLGDSKKLRKKNKIEIFKVLHKYVDHTERSRFLNRTAPANHNSTQNAENSEDSDDILEDHLEEFQENDVNIKNEAHVDPLNDIGNTKIWWT